MRFPNLSRIAVENPSVTLFLLLLSIIGGTLAFLSLGRSEDPAFTVRIMVVSVEWPGASVEEIRDQVVDRLEKRIQDVELLKRVESSIRPGRADLQVEFHDYTPSERVPELFYEVRKRMWDEAPRLPPGVIGPIVNDSFSDVFFSLIALSAPELSMRDIARQADRLRDRLAEVPGVQKVLLIGEQPQQLVVEFDTARLLRLGLRPDQLFDALDAHNRLLPSGFIDTDGPRLELRVDRDLSDPQRLRDLPVRIGDELLRLGDLATIRRGYEDPPRYRVRAASEDALLLGVVMQRGENGLDLGQRIERFLDTEQRELPLGFELRLITHQAEAISQAVDLFQLKFLIALLVVMGVSFLSIGLRAGLIVGIAVPLTLGLSFMLMSVAGINLDRITLGALIIALGLLVDDAIIAIEMMLVKLAEGSSRIEAATAAWRLTAAPMLFGTLVTVAGFVPIGFARSGVGEYAGNIFWVLAFALLISWLVAVVFTPYLGVRLLREGPEGAAAGAHAHDGPAHHRLRSLLTFCLRRRWLVIGATVGLLAAAVAGLAGPVQKQFFPGSDRSEVLVSVYLPEGSAISATERVARSIEADLSELPEVRRLASFIGAGAPRFFISANPEQPNPAFAKLLAVTDDAAARDRLMAELNRRIERGDYAEARVRVHRLLYGPPVAWPIEFRISGDDPDQLRELGATALAIIQRDTRLSNAHLSHGERVPVLRLDVDPERLRRLGLSPRDLAQQLEFETRGLVVSELREGTRSSQLLVRGTAGQEDTDALALELLNERGERVPLLQLGMPVVAFEEPVILRYNRRNMIALRADLRAGQPNDVTAALWRDLAELRAALPHGYRIDIGGSVEQSATADASIQALQPLMLALMLIFIMLQMRSFIGTAVVLATAPLGLIGAVAALLLFQQPFGFVALLGLIGLGGILMRNTLILTQQIADNLAAGMAAEIAIVEATISRARPVLLTALAAVLAFVPLTTDSFWGPLAYVLIGGTAVGTAITLLVVPALYALATRARLPSPA